MLVEVAVRANGVLSCAQYVVVSYPAYPRYDPQPSNHLEELHLLQSLLKVDDWLHNPKNKIAPKKEKSFLKHKRAQLRKKILNLLPFTRGRKTAPDEFDIAFGCVNQAFVVE